MNNNSSYTYKSTAVPQGYKLICSYKSINNWYDYTYKSNLDYINGPKM